MGSLFSSQNKVAVPVKKSYNEFSFELFRVFNTRHQNDYINLCFSPFSVFNTLSMILIGAKGKSEEQLENMLNLKDFNKIKRMYEELQVLRESIIKSNHESIYSATYLYIDQSINLKPEFTQLIREYFEIKPKKVDFSEVEKTVKIMNADASEGTERVIDIVIKNDDLKEKNVKMILSNAFFFHGFWATSFQDISQQTFTCAKGSKTVKIQTMRHLSYHRYLYDSQLKSQVISLEYVCSDLRMIILLPEDRNADPSHLISKLDENVFSGITKKLKANHKILVEVSIPRFGLDAQQVSLQKTIETMGATDIFTESTANLKGMCTANIHLTKIVHKAFLIVDDRGANQEIIKANHSEYVVFKADHPFVFIVYDKFSDVVVFMGRFCDPTEMLEVVSETQLSQQQIHQLLHSTV